jgi:hypothetical protein
MLRQRALQIVLVLVGLLFSAGPPCQSLVVCVAPHIPIPVTL